MPHLPEQQSPNDERAPADERGGLGSFVGRLMRRFRGDLAQPALDPAHINTEHIDTLSHELRTPLTSIKGYIATMLRDPGMCRDTQREFLEIANREADTLGRLVDSYLEQAQAELGLPTTRPDDPESTQPADPSITRRSLTSA